ncbi:hypothetical protein [uncultured Aquimarina sp.]|uniref:hypothetical protein n=1 Tax=uncultured Aquimarina sp. TaxID=575652 RepID=UPI002610620C|nr:hypothetical protein [uncultured Aquimarina sp.]
MKKSLKNLELKKQTISSLQLDKVKGGVGLQTYYLCGNTARTGTNGVPVCMEH